MVFVAHLCLCCSIVFASDKKTNCTFLQHKEREFILKFSAMEIYNESVRDLLNADSTPLRLLDDPEVSYILFFNEELLILWTIQTISLTGSYFDREGQLLRNSQKKLCGTGIILKSFYLCVKVRIISIGLSFTSPLIAYLSMSWCSLAAQRQIGETSLNETSSRSHQILRLVCFVLHCKTFRYFSLDNDMIFILILFIYFLKSCTYVPPIRQQKVLHVNFQAMTNQAPLQPLWYETVYFFSVKDLIGQTDIGKN